MKKITIKDVARAARVSPATVSNVINGVAKCSEDTKFRILQIMEELNYKPNLAAKALVKRKSNLIGVIFPNYSGKNSEISNRNPFIQNIFSGMQVVLNETEDYDILIMEISSAEKVTEWISRRNLDAVILVGMFSGVIVSKIQNFDIPVILIDNYYEEIKGAVYIRSEDTFGGYLAAESLIKKGCKNLVIATGTLVENEIFKRRLYGCLSAFEDYGLQFDEKNIYEDSNVSFLGGKNLGYRILNSNKPDGILVMSDILALGILRVLNEKKLDIPKEIKLIGFDDIPACKYVFPQLSTINQGAYQKGVSAIKKVIEMTEEKNKKIHTDISISVELIQRETT